MRTKLMAGIIATVTCIILIALFIIFILDSIHPQSIDEIIFFGLFLLTGCWLGVFLIIKPDGLKPTDRIETEGKDSDLE